MKFDAHVTELRKGADKHLRDAARLRKEAKENQGYADAYARTAERYIAEAVIAEDLAQGLNLLADALATGKLTADQLRAIVNAVNSDEDRKRRALRRDVGDRVVNICRGQFGFGAHGTVTRVELDPDGDIKVYVEYDDGTTQKAPSGWLVAEQAARDAESEDTDSGMTAETMRKIFGEPVEGRDYTVMPPMPEGGVR